ncbi:cytochrome P450 [Kitasatospora purpeofusca]|uniref:cytochrome P450 n=1 Tax=Kitasatospora purpeofusca TaxID=67352 RepID=UPI002A5A94C1|nr:cytochrome P450 [Kitasatospora purpeofusca]MDY0812270.1 cytochrome P450 [Kitasatospora purpeofusca]
MGRSAASWRSCGRAGTGERNPRALPVRLDPPRRATEDDSLAGYRIGAGTDLLVCRYPTHRDPELWPEPEHFDPSRFTIPGARQAHLAAYCPFGVGARACLGARFALRESTALLELLLPAHAPRFRTTPATLPPPGGRVGPSRSRAGPGRRSPRAGELNIRIPRTKSMPTGLTPFR